MIQVTNSNNQLIVTYSNGLGTSYAFEDMKSITPYSGPSGQFVVINFINENRDSSLKIPFAEINNQPTWLTVVDAALAISAWMDTSIGGGLATEATLQSVEANTLATANNTSGVTRKANMIRPTNTLGNVSSISSQFYSVSVANVGSADGAILTGTTIKPGEVLNFSADALNNYFTDFGYDATGTEFIIIFVTD